MSSPTSRPERVDVVVPIYKDVALTLDCLRSVLDRSGGRLGRLLAIDDASPDPSMAAALAELARSDARVEVHTNERNLGFVGTCNRALQLRRGDVVLLNSDTRVTDGWLAELIDVAYTDERTACVSPLSNNATLCSVPKFLGDTPADQVDEATVRRAVAGLPRSHITPTAVGFCLYLRDLVLQLVGDFDPIYSPGYNEENDWIMRAQSMGFVARRANHAFVYHLGSVSFDQKRTALEEDHARILNERYPHYLPQVRRFCASLDGAMAAHAVRIESSGRMRVALDLRGLGTNRVGSNVYAHRLAELLAGSKQLELTVLERHPQDLERLGVRVLRGVETTVDDVEIVHKPTQVFDNCDLPLLLSSPAHLVITYQDLIAYHAQSVWGSPSIAERYRDMSFQTVQAAQAVIAISEATRREVSAQLGVPTDEIPLVPHGIDPRPFGERREARAALRKEHYVPSRYFFYVGTDFAHKNLAGLVTAYQLLRYTWDSSDGNPPALVLAGPSSSAPEAFYKRLEAAPIDGVIWLGEVDDELLYALYQGALALTFPSVYEGFGLPPLEAMAAGTPVLALPLSSVTEVCGDAALYPSRPDAEALATAMRDLARSPELRAERIAAGRERVQTFTSTRTLELTLAAYRQAWRSPSERSLRARRFAATTMKELLARPIAPPAPAVEPGRLRAGLSSLLRIVGAR
jgi:glycosyltransferase involved in cell wall biosynthesis